jgi:hypothetical protein
MVVSQVNSTAFELLDDLCGHLRFWKGALCLDADSVRGRMMKTRVTLWPNGVVEIQTTNRHQMASRWIGTIKGKKHLRLASADTPYSRAPGNSVVPPELTPRRTNEIQHLHQPVNRRVVRLRSRHASLSP